MVFRKKVRVATSVSMTLCMWCVGVWVGDVWVGVMCVWCVCVGGWVGVQVLVCACVSGVCAGSYLARTPCRCLEQ